MLALTDRPIRPAYRGTCRRGQGVERCARQACRAGVERRRGGEAWRAHHAQHQLLALHPSARVGAL